MSDEARLRAERDLAEARLELARSVVEQARDELVRLKTPRGVLLGAMQILLEEIDGREE